MIKKLLFFLFSFLLINSITVFAQEEECVDETSTNIPALKEFHEVMHPIWHTAYPEKDIDALRKYAEEVKEKALKIYEVKLPGILREKEAKWKAGVETFRNAVDNYLAIAETGNDQAMLDAAEELHTRYENLVRIIRPIVKELEEFHKVLYVIYHRYLPDKKWKEIRNECKNLKEKAAQLSKAKLPKRLEAKNDEFKKRVNALSKSVNSLCRTKDAGMEKAVENMHTRYVKIQELFE